MKGFQLEMQFSSGANRLRECLENGVFSLWIEHAPPPGETDPGVLKRRLDALEDAVLSETALPVSLAITDRGGPVPGGLRGVEYASLAGESTRNCHAVYVSGRNSSPGEMRGLLNMAANAGIRNIVPVTGDAMPGTTARHPGGFTESAAVLSEAVRRGGFFAGTTVNPFKYSPEPLIGQYAKLMRKINTGAQFAVSQAGFDMAKIHELRNYIESRQCFLPLVARLVLLTPEIMAEILTGKRPGIVISRESQAQLRRELCFSAQQFQAAQWRRLELQAAGCRLLGCSGIQLVGADTPERIKVAAERICNAMKEFSSFADWIGEYEAWVGRADLSNHTNGFYFFDRLLRPEGEEVARPVPADFEFQPLSGSEKFRCLVLSSLFPEEENFPPGHRRILKTVFAGCRGCDRCTISKNFLVCRGHCPKKLSFGPCGGGASGGGCEYGGRGCVFNRITRRAGIAGRVDDLETPVEEGLQNG